MKAISKSTKSDALNNDRSLSILPAGYGTWKISCEYYGERREAITHNSSAVDDFNCYYDDPAKCRQGYIWLCEHIAWTFKNKK